MLDNNQKGVIINKLAHIDMNKVKFIVPIFFTLFLISCRNTYEEIDKNKIQYAFTLNSSQTFNGYYYQGSDDRFHYFISKWDLKKDNYFKIRKGDLQIKSPYKFEMKELRIGLFETEEKFGSNEYYELYIIQ